MPNNKGPASVKPVVVVTEHGDIAAGIGRTSYRRGFADLLDLASPPVSISVLPPGASTAIGFTRVGQFLRSAMAEFEEARK